MTFEGHRKFILGLAYIVGCFGCLITTILLVEAAQLTAVLAALGGSFVGVSSGLAVLVYGNSKEWQAKTTNGGTTTSLEAKE